MTEWFYVKNDLTVREDIKGIIMRPIWQSFGLWRSKVEMNEAAEECQRAFGVICSFIGTRDLVQEHIALLGAFGFRRSSKTGFNSISGVQCVYRYLRTQVGITVDQNNTKVDTAPKV
jgi:hypothetical protein